jgi:YVTN family beta-propeller protein
MNFCWKQRIPPFPALHVMQFSSLPLLLATASVLIFSACKSGDGSDDPGLSIDYPAAYVVNGGDGTISVLNLATQKIAATIDLSGAAFPHHISLSPDQSTLAVAITGMDLSGGHQHHGSGATGPFKVLLIDATTGEIHHEIGTPELPHNAAFNAAGTELWVPQTSAPGRVIVYETINYTEIAAIAVGKKPAELTFSADGSRVFVANTESGTVSMIDPHAKTVVETIAVGNSPIGAWPASNGHMYVDNEISQTVHEIEVATGAITTVIELDFKTGFVAYHTPAQELWVSDATYGRIVYYRQEAGSWTEKGSIETGADPHGIAFSADGKMAYVINQRSDNVSIIDVGSHTKIKDVPVGSKPNGLVLKQ